MFHRHLLPLVGVAILSGCLKSSTGPNPPPPAFVQPVENPVSAQVASQVEVSVRVIDATGTEMQGIGVGWTSDEGITISQTITRTDASGIATTTVTLGTMAGPFEVRASVEGLSPVAISITAEPGPATTLTLSEESIAFTAVQQTRDVDFQALDAYGNSIQSAVVAWQSRNTGVATVDGSGTIAAQGAGQTYVVAATGAAQDSVAVSVTTGS